MCRAEMGSQERRADSRQTRPSGLADRRLRHVQVGTQGVLLGLQTLAVGKKGVVEVEDRPHQCVGQVVQLMSRREGQRGAAARQPAAGDGRVEQEQLRFVPLEVGTHDQPATRGAGERVQAIRPRQFHGVVDGAPAHFLERHGDACPIERPGAVELPYIGSPAHQRDRQVRGRPAALDGAGGTKEALDLRVTLRCQGLGYGVEQLLDRIAEQLFQNPPDVRMRQAHIIVDPAFERAACDAHLRGRQRRPGHSRHRACRLGEVDVERREGAPPTLLDQDVEQIGAHDHLLRGWYSEDIDSLGQGDNRDT